MNYSGFLLLWLLVVGSCNENSFAGNNDGKGNDPDPVKIQPPSYSGAAKTIHVFVALCDNQYQGIVPVPARIGNGQDPDNNLYWGTSYGIRTYFKKSREWKFLYKEKREGFVLERVVFKHVNKNYYLVADAYDGRFIKNATVDFFKSSSGQIKDTLEVDHTVIGLYGNAKLIAYIGHDGLMDFKLDEAFRRTDREQRDCIVLACYSRNYFKPHLKPTGTNPLLWTTGLMAPEAYTLHDALSGYIQNEPAEKIRVHAARAYSHYQKCSEKAARNLLVSGW
ncbi:hypothetical protein [Niabella beijingensis]|uniref:hypothetical protein n=1 Tax=Niabella beijingensis TaxID=2872700 RepID=UPI001CBDCFEC|nr:hypothetical protein [Niabella beijingensis]MBZ4190693.1 hypothetical protein [Niabella beijingensis]